MLIIERITLEELPVQREYLMKLDRDIPSEKTGAIPVYWRNKETGSVFFISDFVLRDNKLFEKNTQSNSGLYRGGGLLDLKTEEGRVVIPDERFHWLRPIGGIAKFSEAEDLSATAIRESVIEELFITSPDEKIRYVPVGIDGTTLSCEWGFSAMKIQNIGNIKFEKYFFNEQNRAFEALVSWEIKEKIKVFHNEDWYAGGRSGIVPVVIEKYGRIVGIYSGRQGLIDIPVSNAIMELHPTLASILHISR